jgi:hypothetical protein
MTPLVALGWLTDSAWPCSSSPRPRIQAHTVKRHVAAQTRCPLWERHRDVLTGHSYGC